MEDVLIIEPIFKVKSESLRNIFLGFIAVLFILFLGGVFLFLKTKSGITTGLVLISIAITLFYRNFINVHFFDDYVICKNLFRTSKKIPYNCFTKMYRVEMGASILSDVFIVRYYFGGKKGKFTFSCSDYEYEEIKKFINEKRSSSLPSKK